MFIDKVLTCNGGWNELTGGHAAQFSEIQELLKRITAEELRTRYSFRAGTVSALSIHRAWDSQCKRNGWLPHRVTQSETHRLFLRALKAKISLKVLASDTTQFPNWLFFESQRSFDLGVIDVAVLLVPMEELTELYELGNRHMPAFNFTVARDYLDALQPLRTIVPFVIVGFGEHSVPVEVYEIFTDRSIADPNLIERCIEFKPEQYQAGMSILAYFGEVLEQKHPGMEVKVRIEQDGNFVRMHVETPDGMKSVVEKTLEEYSLVISNKAAPESLFDNKIQILQLQNKLALATLEVKQTREILQLTHEMYAGRLSSLEEDVNFLRQQLGTQLTSMDKAHKIISSQVRCHRDIIVAQIESSGNSLDNLIRNYSSDLAVTQSLQFIKQKLEAGLCEGDKSDIDAAVQVIAANSSSVLYELGEAVKGTSYGVAGNILYQWLLPTISMLG
ncbi:hypothetical protein [Pseudoduganella sp. GCM10020061]|uniref:hypothetical protein n=1 Tax=Pseudoduganella sp. GCM10020061 TaxID=3317345 RepID=UPI00363FAECC